jgi:phage gp46-like protein
MAGDTDAVLSTQTHTSDDHLLVDLAFEDDLLGTLTGTVDFTRSTTATYVDKDDGLIKTAAVDVPRFETNGLLIEGDSENLLLRSEEFDNAAWGDVGSNNTISDTDVAPDGTTTADKIGTNTTPSVAHGKFQSFTYLTGTAYTLSCYVKQGTYAFLCIDFNNTADKGAVFDLSDGSIGFTDVGVTASVDVLSNQWFRCKVTFTPGALAGFPEIYLSGSRTSNLRNFTALGTENILYWGAQLEELEFASSYIPTTTVAVTRETDNVSIDADNIPDSDEDFSWESEVSLLGLGTLPQVLSNVEGETFRLIRASNPSNVQSFAGGTTITGPAVDITTTRITTTMDVSDTSGGHKLYTNGVFDSQLAGGTTTGTKTQINLGNRSSTNYLFGHIANFKIYDSALTAAQVAGTEDITETVDVDYDISFDAAGDIETDDFFDTSILYSLFGERRANASEILEPRQRRGWIGNEDKDFENGSKLWLFEQARLTQSNLNRIEDEAKKALQWLVDDGYAISVDEVTASVDTTGITLELIIRRSRSNVERRFFALWQNTGLR